VTGPKPLLAPNSDFDQFAETLSADKLATLKKVRTYMEKKVAPILVISNASSLHRE
jgi:glutaryl-CoA dehydrogenase